MCGKDSGRAGVEPPGGRDDIAALRNRHIRLVDGHLPCGDNQYFHYRTLYLENLEKIYKYIEKIHPVVKQKSVLNRYKIKDNFLFNMLSPKITINQVSD